MSWRETGLWNENKNVNSSSYQSDNEALGRKLFESGAPGNELNQWQLAGYNAARFGGSPGDYVSTGSNNSRTSTPSGPSPGSLVSNQLNDILNKDNSLMRTAKAQGLEYANSRGALNSDQGGEAAMTAMIKGSTPIAQGNAQAWQNYDIQKMQNDLQMRLAYDNNSTRLTDTMLSGMMSVFRTPDAVWTQDMQNDAENVINAYTPWAAGLYGIPLTGSLTA